MIYKNISQSSGTGPVRSVPPSSVGLPSSMVESITLRAFKAPDDPDRCQEFVRQHVQVLEDIGVFSALQPDLSWCNDENVIVLVAEHAQLGMVAGIRVHQAAYGAELPMQHCLVGLDPTIEGRLTALLPNGNAEIAGLWNTHRFAGRGIPMLLMEAAVAVASQLDIHTMVTFIAEYVAHYAAKTGFVLMDDLKEGGIFVFPVPEIKTHAMILPDVLTMSNAHSEDRQRIVSLRLRTHQTRMEQPRHDLLEVQYALLEPTPSIDEVAGRSIFAA